MQRGTGPVPLRKSLLRRGTLCFFTRSRKVISAILNPSSHLADARYPLQLRWRPLAAAEAGAAASGAAGMPVRWPRRPAGASAADAETDLELSCGALENDRAVTRLSNSSCGLPTSWKSDQNQSKVSEAGALEGVRFPLRTCVITIRLRDLRRCLCSLHDLSLLFSRSSRSIVASQPHTHTTTIPSHPLNERTHAMRP